MSTKSDSDDHSSQEDAHPGRITLSRKLAAMMGRKEVMLKQSTPRVLSRAMWVLALTFGLLILSGQAAQAQGTVVGSKHDLRAVGGGTPTGTNLNEVCVVCHTPHQAAAANSQDPLWNHTATATAAFGVYASVTLNASPITDIGGAAIGSQSLSMLCMSCHDGTVSVLSMYNPPNTGFSIAAVPGRISATGNIISNANMGTSLTDDHPVNFTYNTALATADGGLRDPATTPAVAALIPGGTVQCSSCHTTHDPTNIPFLRLNNTGSALCLTCHIK
jgi:predicted CXXCH cytochrome family protein